MRRRRAREAEHQLHHLLHLVLFRAPIADDRALDFSRRVLDDGHAGFDGGEHGHAARVAELQRAPGVSGEENAFDGDVVGAAFTDERRQAGVDP